MKQIQNSILGKLIYEQLDGFKKRLLQLCSIPSFFTRDLVVSCLPAICIESDCISYTNKDIDDFLSLPFISRRTTHSGTQEIEYYMIHQLVKDIVTLSSEEWGLYCSALIDYFDTMCLTALPPLHEKYFYEKLLCEVKINKLSSWRSAYHAAVEMNRIQECNKLYGLLGYLDKSSDWYVYYSFVNQYVNKEPVQSLLPKLMYELETVKFSDKECILYLQILIGVFYDIIGQWDNSLRLYQYIETQLSVNNPVENDIMDIIHINLATVCCRKNDLDTAKRSIAYIERVINNLDLGIQIAAFRAIGFFAKRSYDWELAKKMYQQALALLAEQQRIAVCDLSELYKAYRPFPLYRSDEIGIYNCLGEILLAQGDFQHALQYHQKELQAQYIAKDETGIAWAEFNLGKTQYLAGDSETACETLFDSMHQFSKTANKANRAYPLGELSCVLKYLGKPNLSFQYLEESINILSQSKDIRGCLNYLRSLGIVGQAQGFLMFAGQIFELCLRYNKMHGKGWTLNSYARNSMFLGDYRSAEENYLRARDMFIQNFDKRGLSYVYNNMAELYVKMGNTTTASELFNQSLSMKVEMGDQHAICYTYRELGELFLRQNEFEQAFSNLDKADRICRERKYVMLQGDIALSYGKLMMNKEKYEDALAFFEEALANYQQQNYYSRIIYCCNMMKGLPNVTSNTCQNLSLNSILSNTMKRKDEEELLMMNRIKPLIKRVEDLIAFSDMA